MYPSVQAEEEPKNKWIKVQMKNKTALVVRESKAEKDPKAFFMEFDKKITKLTQQVENLVKMVEIYET